MLSWGGGRCPILQWGRAFFAGGAGATSGGLCLCPRRGEASPNRQPLLGEAECEPRPPALPPARMDVLDRSFAAAIRADALPLRPLPRTFYPHDEASYKHPFCCCLHRRAPSAPAAPPAPSRSQRTYVTYDDNAPCRPAVLILQSQVRPTRADTFTALPTAPNGAFLEVRVLFCLPMRRVCAVGWGFAGAGVGEGRPIPPPSVDRVSSGWAGVLFASSSTARPSCCVSADRPCLRLGLAAGSAYISGGGSASFRPSALRERTGRRAGRRHIIEPAAALALRSLQSSVLPALGGGGNRGALESGEAVAWARARGQSSPISPFRGAKLRAPPPA